MARVIKIDNSVLKRLKYKRGKKKPSKRKVNKYFLIVCEGTKTEPNYFNSIKNSIPSNILETISIDIEGTGKNTLSIVEATINLRDNAMKYQEKSFDEIWVVFDKDSFKSDNFDNAIHKAKSNKIEVAWSNEAFELWYLLHFIYRSTPMSREDYKKSVESEINRKIKEITGKDGQFKYEKNSVSMYQILQKYGDEAQAIAWAKALCDQYINLKYSSHNPRTLVYKLIEKLNGINQNTTDKR